MEKGLFHFMVLLVFVAWSGATRAEKTKQALRALEKQDYEKTEEILLKSMQKDSLNPGTEYVWALLYSNENYPKYHLDSAHLFIKNACEYLNLKNEDHLDELDDADLFEYDIKNQKIAIDSMAFARAIIKNDIEGFEHFITLYKDAADYTQAVSIRNRLVFEEVQSVHTWQAYRKFMTNFPEAAQIEKAQIQYDKLIYEDKTKSGDIEDLEKFLKMEPNTPYRHSIEKKIFEDYIGELDKDKMMTFLYDYGNSMFASKTLNMLYHLDGFDHSQIEIPTDIKTHFMDSVRELEMLNKEPLAISLQDNEFQFLDLDGKVFVDKTYNQVNEAYRCGNVLNNLLQVESGNVTQLINRKGEVIFEGFSGRVEDLGSGLLAVEENEKLGLLHKSGFTLLAAEFDDLRLFENSVVVFEKEGKFGVMGVSGHEYIKPVYDDIVLKGAFWVFQKENSFGVTNLDAILKAKHNIFSLEMSFDEVEWINDKYIIGFKEDAEVLINSSLEVLSPAFTKRINTRHETWVIELPDGYTTFDPELGQLSSNLYQQVLQNTEWLGLARNNKWFVYNKNIYDEPIIGVDSLKLLGEDIAIVFRGSAGMAIFPNKQLVEVKEEEYLKSIGPKIQADTHYLVIRRRGENILYKDGEEQFRLICDELGYISDSAFYVKKNGKYGAVGLDGRLIMRIRYDAISIADNGVAAVLYNGKFGAYNFRDRVLLKIGYQEKLKPYNSTLFIVNEEGKYGLLDRFNKVRVVPAYDKIEYWSDSTLLGQRDGTWNIIKMADEKILLSGIEYYEYIKDTPEEKILLVRKEKGYGVYHSDKGIIIPTVFHDVMNLGNNEKQLYFTETAVSEADIYVVVYYDTQGNKLSSRAYRSEKYERLVCEDQ